VLLALAPPGIPRLEAIRIDGMVLGFAAAVSVLAAVIFGVLPALFVGRGDLQATLRDGSRGTGDGRKRVRMRSLLVISEFAMALVLLTTAGLVIRTMNAMLAVDAGYDPRNVLSMRVSLRGTEDTTPARRALFFQEAIARASALPGVEAASSVNHLPLHGDLWRFPYTVEGAPPIAAHDEQPAATFRIARHGYFGVMRIPFIEGRDFRPDEATSGAQVVIVNETMAKRRWPDGSALGRRITVDGTSNPDWFTVIGVVREVRQGSWTEPSTEEMYFPQLATSASPSGTPRLIDFLNPVSMTLVVRTATDPAGAATPIREAIQALNPNVAISDVITMGDAVAEQFAVPRFYLILFGVFAAVALVLALVGVYGVLSYSVARRSQELGLRLALGASRSDPFRLIIGQGLRLVAWGTAVGIGVSLLVTQLVSGLLFRVEPTDPITFLGASVVLASIALAGCIVPAWRAATLDPIIALRAE
jgi:predicted permease